MSVKWAKVTNDGSVLLVWKERRGHSNDIKMKKYLKLWHEVNNEAKAKQDNKKDLKLAGQAVKQITDKLKKALKKWPDKSHPYYKDIQKIVKESNPSMRMPGGRTVRLPY
jgi:gas vesicle protein|tara:strand:+ start:2294 stop:2623 length:330 start_codon:yes stop_codon:yes gene_type:complete